MKLLEAEVTPILIPRAPEIPTVDAQQLAALRSPDY
jgi:hypothetical protein